MISPLETLLYSNLRIELRPKGVKNPSLIIKTTTESNFYYVGPSREDITISCSEYKNINTINRVTEFRVESAKGHPGKVYCAIQDNKNNLLVGFNILQTYSQIMNPGPGVTGQLPPYPIYFDEWMRVNGLKKS
ncbi:hypothetical protein KY332_04415 [Candidatus Woesearchaeota archaeon]|nr:hypothetical protein [Candidatus Woesearchaeota archaeon]